MTYRRGRAFSSRAPARRKSTWIGPADQAYVGVNTGLSVIIQSFDPAAGSALTQPTIVRTRGLMSVKLQVYSADLDCAGALGMCIVSDEAFAAGAASIPRPFDDANWDGWFVWVPWVFRFSFDDATGTQFPASYQVEIDSKAMRKVSDNETVVVMAESQVGAVSVAANFRQLYKLA